MAPEGRMKCTIHKNGKLGFSRAAIKKLGILQDKYAKLGFNEENKDDKNLYLVVQSYSDEETYKVNKAGEYYYLNTKHLFDNLHIDYERRKIIFDMQEIDSEGTRIYRLNKREIVRK